LVAGKIHLIPLLLLVQLLTLLVKISVRTMTRNSRTQRRKKKIASLLVTRTQTYVVTSIMVLGKKIALLPAKQAAHVTIPRVQFYYRMGSQKHAIGQQITPSKDASVTTYEQIALLYVDYVKCNAHHHIYKPIWEGISIVDILTKGQ